MPSDFLMILPSFIRWMMVIFLGMALGSFTTCVMYRLPRGISLWRQENGSQRSFCPSCGHDLRWIDLVPVLSWVLQKGKCRYCKTPVSAYYPCVELLVTLSVAVLFILIENNLYFLVAAFAVPFIAGFGAMIRMRMWR